VRLGIVGCGRLAERGYLPALADVADARLVAVADPAPQRRSLLVEAASTVLGQRVAAYAGADELLAGAQVDAVLIASPVGSHVADARAVAVAGVAALVEKPPATDPAGAAELAGLTPRPWLGFNRRFDPGAVAVRSAVPPSGDVDLLLRISYRRPSWGAHTVRDDALLDLGPHLLDWARWLTGSEVVAVACPTLGAERAVLDLTLGRGRARLEAATDRPHEELVEVRDRAGRLVGRHRTGGLVAGVRSRLLGRGPDALVTSLRGELAALVAAVRGVPSPDLGTPADGIVVMAAIAAARESAADGGRRVLLPIEEHR
jgi:predicted dehydrogenase